MNKKGLLIVMSGPSGTGKGTVCEELKKDESVFVSVSMTSRNIRENEIDGVTYYYTTPEKFESMIENGKMLEWAKYNGNYYGTPREAVEKMLNEGKNVLLEIEVQGALQVKKKVPDCVMIFIVPPGKQALYDRLKRRGTESEEIISQRIKKADREFKKAYLYDYIVVNDEVNNAADRIMAIIRAEHAKTARSIHKYMELIGERED